MSLKKPSKDEIRRSLAKTLRETVDQYTSDLRDLRKREVRQAEKNLLRKNGTMGAGASLMGGGANAGSGGMGGGGLPGSLAQSEMCSSHGKDTSKCGPKCADDLKKEEFLDKAIKKGENPWAKGAKKPSPGKSLDSSKSGSGGEVKKGKKLGKSELRKDLRPPGVLPGAIRSSTPPAAPGMTSPNISPESQQSLNEVKALHGQAHPESPVASGSAITRQSLGEARAMHQEAHPAQGHPDTLQSLKDVKSLHQEGGREWLRNMLVKLRGVGDVVKSERPLNKAERRAAFESGDFGFCVLCGDHDHVGKCVE